MNKRLTLILLPLMLMLSACSTDTYDTGDGSLSHMRADFVEVLTDADTCMVAAETDDGDRLYLTPSVRVAWMEQADTVYRALLYYNKVETDGNAIHARPLNIVRVLVPPVVPISAIKGEIKTDPITFESSWKSRNGKYLNIGFYVKTGTVDGDYGSQSIGIICDDVATNADGTRTVNLRLHHDQNNSPEYYSVLTYASIAVSQLPIQPSAGDKVLITIETYEGTITRTFLF